MRQIDYQANSRPSLALGPKKVRAADKAMREGNAARRRDDLKARNAYRRAIGLPEVEK